VGYFYNYVIRDGVCKYYKSTKESKRINIVQKYISYLKLNFQYCSVYIYESKLEWKRIDMLAPNCQFGRQVCVFPDWKTSQWNVAL